MRTKSIIKIIKNLIKKAGFRVIKTDSILPDTVLMQKLLYFNRMFNVISSIEGDIVECGVGEGKTFLLLAFLISNDRKRRKLWGFDSFEGFPEPTSEDESFRKPKKGEWARVSPEDVIDLLRRVGIDKKLIEEDIIIKKGFFRQTLNSYQGNQISLLHIDADLYDSYKVALKELFPRVTERGVVLFDEYNEPKWPGATKAVDEYFKGTEYKISYDKISGEYYVIK